MRAWGPGLHEGIAGKSADFVVESIGTEVGSLGKSAWLSWLGFSGPLMLSCLMTIVFLTSMVIPSDSPSH